MASRGQVAKAVRLNKERHPERYCSDPGCLWALSSGPCRKHPGLAGRCQGCHLTRGMNASGNVEAHADVYKRDQPPCAGAGKPPIERPAP